MWPWDDDNGKGAYIDPTKPADPATGLPPPPAGFDAKGNPLPQQPQGPVEQPEFPAENDTNKELNDSISQQLSVEGSTIPDAGPQGTPGEVVSGQNMLIYGPQGAQLADETFNQGPQRYAAAARSGAQAAESQGKDEENFWKKESMRQAIAAQTFQRDQQERQRLLAGQLARRDELAKKLSNDMADTGKFWRDPGHVMIGFVTALSSLGSASNHEMMVKDLQEMVNRDFIQRKTAADMQLSNADNNINIYRQLFHDRDVSDMYALGESYRVAANELKEISAHYAGPQAKSRAEMAIEALNQQSNMLQMNALQKAYMSPQVAPKLVADALKKMQANNPGQITNYLQPRGPNNPGTAAPMAPQAPQADGGIPSTPEYASDAPTSAPLDSSLEGIQNRQVAPGVTGSQLPEAPARGGQSSLSGMSSAPPDFIGAVRKATGHPGTFERDYAKFTGIAPPTQAQLAEYDRRSPGFSNNYKHWLNNMIRSARLAHPGNLQAQRQEFHKLYKQDEEKANSAAGAAFQKGVEETRGWAQFKGEVNRVQAAAKAFGKTPDEFLTWARQLPVGQSLVSAYRKEQLRNAEPKTQQELENIKTLEASENFHQALAGKTVAYYNKMIGGNQSVSERELIENVIDPSANWSKIKGFVDQQSQAAGARYQSAMKQVGPGGMLILMMRQGNQSAPSGMDVSGHKREEVFTP